MKIAIINQFMEIDGKSIFLIDLSLHNCKACFGIEFILCGLGVSIVFKK